MNILPGFKQKYWFEAQTYIISDNAQTIYGNAFTVVTVGALKMSFYAFYTLQVCF